MREKKYFIRITFAEFIELLAPKIKDAEVNIDNERWEWTLIMNDGKIRKFKANK